MMKYVILAVLAIAAVQAQQRFGGQQQQQQQRPRQGQTSELGEGLTAYSFDNEGTGNYHWNYASVDGSQQDQTGSLKRNPDPQAEHQDIQNVVGSFSYQTPEGKTVRVEYTGDEGGYKQRTTIQ